MWRRVDLIHSFLPLVAIATFWCAVYAQSDKDGPFNTSHVECIRRPCARSWWTSMWGFVVTLVALTMDFYGYAKVSNKNIPVMEHAFIILLLSAFNPLFILWFMVESILLRPAMLANLREVLGDDVIAPLFPWRKSNIKILNGCTVIVNLSPDVHRDNHNLNAFADGIVVVDLSEALVIGHKVANSKQFDIRLSGIGQLALLRSNLLPPYDELKIVQGNSSVGVAIASAQATGYIYGIIVRCVQGLRVSPIEAIACVLNMVIFMKGVLHSFASIGHRPLLLYFLPEEEAKFIEECKNVQNFGVKVRGRMKLAISIVCGICLVVGGYFIVNFLKSLDRIFVGPLILFEVSLLMGGIQGLAQMSTNDSTNLDTWLIFPPLSLSFIGYVWALKLTFAYWRDEEFDVQSSNYLSQVLPYIG